MSAWVRGCVVGWLWVLVELAVEGKWSLEAAGQWEGATGTGSELLSSRQGDLGSFGDGSIRARAVRRTGLLRTLIVWAVPVAVEKPDRHQQTHPRLLLHYSNLRGRSSTRSKPKTPHLNHVILMLAFEDNLYL